LEIGDSFSMGINEDREIYSWGMNDSNQCARHSESMHAPLGKTNTLSSNCPKLLSLGKDHGIMADESGRIYAWG
jgi:alpha-tubulin suppressor-like RCC1 family protein